MPGNSKMVNIAKKCIYKSLRPCRNANCRIEGGNIVGTKYNNVCIVLGHLTIQYDNVTLSLS